MKFRIRRPQATPVFTPTARPARAATQHYCTGCQQTIRAPHYALDAAIDAHQRLVHTGALNAGGAR